MKRSPVQTVALIFGVVFLLVGLAGFVPGLTSHVGDLQFFGHNHANPSQLLGTFDVSWFHNIVHLLFGVAGLLLSRTQVQAKAYLVVGGVIYLVLFIVGLFLHGASDSVNFVPVNGADNWLHLVLGIVMVVAGAALGSRAADPTDTAVGDPVL